MTKKDLQLIGAFIDTKNPKVSLNYAHLLEDGVYATDTRKCIHFNIPMLGLNMLLHKKVFGGFISGVGKDDSVSIDGLGYLKLEGGHKMSCDTWDSADSFDVDFKRILNQEMEFKMTLTDIDDLYLELTQKDCFVHESHLMPIIEFGGCSRYEIFFNKQKVDKDTTNTGLVKIVGIFNEDDEIDKIKFTAVVMGREFKTQAQEQLLMEL